MGRNQNNVKRNASDRVFGLLFEEIDGGDRLHQDREVSEAILARGRSALRLFSVGES